MEKARDVLVVDDNPADARLAREAFKLSPMASNVHLAKDGVEALAFLRREGNFASAARPDLIFLDLNLPRKDGREVLAEIKNDPDLKRIPVIVLTTSRAQNDILKSYDLHANCYAVKPLDLDQFVDMICNIEEFWLSTAVLPPA